MSVKKDFFLDLPQRLPVNTAVLSCSIIEKCRGCHGAVDSLEPILVMDPMPPAGMFCGSREEAIAAPVFPLSWVQCRDCGLVQVREDIPDRELFSHYNYASSTVSGLVRHFIGYAEFLVARYRDAAHLRLLEIGCNDGVLLSRLPAAWHLVGVDPSDVASRAAAGQERYELRNEPFDSRFVAQNQLEGAFDVISGSNCLAHLSDLKDVFEAVARALRTGGHFWLEVHDLEALLHGAQWDTIYHEHKAEWSEQALRQCLERLGFAHRETFRTPMHGGALRVCFEKLDAAKRSLEPWRENTDPRLAALRHAYNSRYETGAARRLSAAQVAGKRIAAYGAAGRANVYLNQLPQIRFDYIVDESPLRLDKFIPRVATPIVRPTFLIEKPPVECLVTAWNYKADIIRKNPDYGGDWVTAFGD